MATSAVGVARGNGSYVGDLAASKGEMFGESDGAPGVVNLGTSACTCTSISRSEAQLHGRRSVTALGHELQQ